MGYQFEQKGRIAIAGIAAVLSAVLIIGSQASAQQTDTAMQQALLVPGAPAWAKWASSSVFQRFTPRWQALSQTLALQGAGKLSVVPSPEPIPNAVVSFGAQTFNRDTTVMSQNETTVAFDPLSAARVVGGYNDYRGLILASGDFTGWTISTNGKTPLKDGELPKVTVLGTPVPSGGDPVVAVDLAGNFFLGSIYFDPNDQDPNAIVVARSPKSGSPNGVFSVACTGGDGDPDCWPTLKIVAQDHCTGASGFFNDKDYIAVDDSQSVATGSVYVVWTRFACNNKSSSIVVAKCKNDLSACTAPVTLETTTGLGAAIDFVQLSHIAVSKDSGKVYLTWNKFLGSSAHAETDTLRMRVITPSANPAVVGTLGPLRTVTVEKTPIPFDTFPYPGGFRLATYPHVGIFKNRAIVVWDRRPTGSLLVDTNFFDSNIMARFTDNDGASFSADQIVSTAATFQYQPAICVDTVSGRVVVDYFSSQNDLVSKHRQDVYIATSPTGAAPYTPLRVTSVSNITENNPVLGDSFIGDYTESACGPNFAYVHYTANYTAKSDSPFDPVPVVIPQQDNFLAKVTLP